MQYIITIRNINKYVELNKEGEVNCNLYMIIKY